MATETTSKHHNEQIQTDEEQNKQFFQSVKNIPLKFWKFMTFNIILPTVDVITDIIQCVIHLK